MKTLYKSKLVDSLKKELGEKNTMAIPKVLKINVNVGIGSYIQAGEKNFDAVVGNLTALTGQKPLVTKAKKAISNFKLREGMANGVTVTLRGQRMYDFLERIVHIVLPRIRDFRGISAKGFDGKGNYSFGIKEVTVFPEVNPDNISRNHGLQITIGTTAQSNWAGYLLLKGLGFPFRDQPANKGWLPPSSN